MRWVIRCQVKGSLLVLCDRSCCALILVDIPTQPLAGFGAIATRRETGFLRQFYIRA
ncbi:MAG: hypothetical protein EBE86_005715 [Hormoscilla sp. GUM202]|nr:hypothetical protein [Hormoscilla sp. GUM202]